MDNKKSENAAQELDTSLGNLLINIESLEAIHTEMGHVREKVDNVDHSSLTSLGLTLMDISHKIVMVDDLLRYSLKDVVKNYEDCQYIKTDLLLEFVEQEKRPLKNQGSN